MSKPGMAALVFGAISCLAIVGRWAADRPSTEQDAGTCLYRQGDPPPQMITFNQPYTDMPLVVERTDAGWVADGPGSCTK